MVTRLLAEAVASPASEEETGAGVPGHPEPAVAAKIITLTKTTPPQPTKNLIKKANVMLMGPQIQPVAAIGLKAEELHTALIPWFAVGQTSLHHVKETIIIEKLAVLGLLIKLT